jgi:2-C-methyl-D-erythritol 2,4-cyclodiphosphate synthase
MAVRIGYGYDVHQFEEGDGLILGGITIPYSRKLKGHSDADVLLHAITDALLGALSLGDIGTHFPDSDANYKGADSARLLERAYQLVTEHGYIIGNIDSTVVAEEPRLKPYIPAIEKRIAAILGCPENAVSVKATTNEKMGAIGRGEGILAQAVVLIQSDRRQT